MLPSHNCYIYGTWRSKEVGGLNSSYGGKLKEGSHKVKRRGLPTYLYLPISASFDLKKIL